MAARAHWFADEDKSGEAKPGDEKPGEAGAGEEKSA